MEANELLEERRGRVLLLTLNRPAKLNAFTADQYERLRHVLERARADDGISAVILTGAGRAFSAGADRSLLEGGEAGERAAERFYPLIRALAAFDKPLIVAMNGLAVGIGATLQLHCDVVLAAPAARLRFPFAELGVPPEAASSTLLPAAIGWQRAARVLFDADWISAEQALGLGLVSEIVPSDQLLERAWALGRRYGERPLTALRAAKRLLIEARAPAVEAALQREMEASRRVGEERAATPDRGPRRG